MPRSGLAIAFAGCAFLMVAGVVLQQAPFPPSGSEASANQDYQLTGPYTHKNLAIYLIHREGR